jgi:processive 1,2-diacylglycerol beta-glucosyltransferase
MTSDWRGDIPGSDRPTTRDALPSITIVSASIGAGHDGAARELARRLSVAGYAVRRHDFLDLLPPGLGGAIRDTYARQLRHAPASWGWLLRAAEGRRLCTGAGTLSAGLAAARILAVVDPATDAVVSTYPLASQVLGRLRRGGRLGVPVAAVMTDPSVHPLCVADGVDLHIGGTGHTVAALRAMGCARAEHAGPVVDPAFQPGLGLPDAYEARRRLGLPLIERLAVVVAGSWGVGDVESTVADIAASRSAVPVVVCGRNDALRRRLRETGDAIALGWVDDMPSLLRAADVVVHNAGGLSSLEAMASGVPVVSYRCLPGHGAANAAVLEAALLSPWPQSRDELATVLERALDGDLLGGQAVAYRRLTAAPDAAALIAGLSVARPATSARTRAVV